MGAFFNQNASQLLDVVVYIITLIGIIYTVNFISKVRKCGTELQKKALKIATMDTIEIVLWLGLLGLGMKLFTFVMGIIKVVDPITLPVSELSSSLLLTVIIYQFSYDYHKRSPQEQEKVKTSLGGVFSFSKNK